MKHVRTSDSLQVALDTSEFIDDFHEYVSADKWTLIATDSGTATLNDAQNGTVTLAASDGTVADNDESYLHTTKEFFLFAADKPLDSVFRVQFAEANTDDANVVVGFMSAVAANHLQDDGAGPAATYSGAVFFKVDGNVNWWVEHSLAGTQTTVELTAANSLDGQAHVAGSASFQELRIQYIPKSGTKADINFFIDGVHVYKMTDVSNSSATEMAALVGLKNGSANAETIDIDLVTVAQKR